MNKQPGRIDEILTHLSIRGAVNVIADGASIELRQCAKRSSVVLKTPIYRGDNYIPKSVRNALNCRELSFFSHLATFFEIDEGNFTIYLNHAEKMGFSDPSYCQEVLYQFHEIAEKWRLFLDEREKNDLIYIHSRFK